MNKLGRILIADDDETFLKSTADLLRREGYECDISPDAETVRGMLKASTYELLIADIRMPGNSELELVKELQEISEGMPVILVTGNPSLDTATQSIQLPVTAYMAKPLDFAVLLMHIKNSISKYRTYCSFQSTSHRLQEWQKDLESIKDLVSSASETPMSVPINTFFKLTFRNIADSLLDLEHLIEGLNTDRDEQFVCNLLDCPSITKLKNGLTETVEVLNKTKSAFKSKDLGTLRKKLEMLTRTVEK
jgi:DNA-binding response OmpR family regulator